MFCEDEVLEAAACAVLRYFALIAALIAHLSSNINVPLQEIGRNKGNRKKPRKNSYLFNEFVLAFFGMSGPV
jgi:hypothetical protein